MIRVAMCEDEIKYVNQIKSILDREKKNWRLDVFHTKEQLEEKLEREEYALYLLDIHLSNEPDEEHDARNGYLINIVHILPVLIFVPILLLYEKPPVSNSFFLCQEYFLSGLHIVFHLRTLLLLSFVYYPLYKKRHYACSRMCPFAHNFFTSTEIFFLFYRKVLHTL